MVHDEADFGAYLVSVAERDIDLLLMEEFHISEEFVRWFCDNLGVEATEFNGAWHSVSDADGETDLLLRVVSGHERIGIMIENKVGAPEQDKQDERYHIRGVRSQQAGKFDRFLTVICAPQAYLNGLSEESLYQFKISYEVIADWFSRQEGRRHAWRHRIMKEAIEQGRKGYVMIVNAAISEFQTAYWEYLQRHYPQIQMRKPTAKGNNSNWIILKTLGMPKGTHFDHKIEHRVIELGFDGRSVTDILAVKSDWPEDVFPVQRGRTAALSIKVPWIDMSQPVSSQATLLDQVFGAVLRLAPYARMFNPGT